MSPDSSVDVAGVSHVGGRDDNQDRFAIVGDWLAVLSDGMGGQAGGALAAQLTVEAVTDSLAAPSDVCEAGLLEAFAHANERVRTERQERVEENRMGATLTVAARSRPGGAEWLVAHVGDSPGFLVTPTSILRLTDDHTVAWELVRQGAISEAAAEEHPQRNVLLRAIGAEDTVQADVRDVHLNAGDALVLVSDGISGVVPLSEIRELVRAAETAEHAAKALVQTAVEHDATDNVTAVVVRQLIGAESSNGGVA
ncbi:MAG: serine/threonine-protein phosphatase [Actinobacteria bacterium]|nr:serine/threonine-protein phosphatase [Actinomycetota bacterium]